ncbi:MAG: polyprenyl diphosphate synthase [Aquiluna sp.]|nr:polyprenyl diphosphate synthase [Aquiluna sp.]
MIKLNDPSRQIPGFGAVPKHIAMVMDGNGRWANERGLTRTEGHRAGEAALLEAVAGATSAGVENLTAYAFSTENWKRSTDEVKFLMGYNKDVLRRRRDLLMDWNVRIRWSGEERKLWPSVVRELRIAEEMTKNNTGLVLTMAVNYGGRQEIVAAVNKILQEIRTGGAAPKSINEKTIQKRLYVPELPDVDMFLRSSGEMRISNFMLWQSSYAEMIFMDVLWPDFTRESLWEAISEFGRRQRRFGGASDAPLN